MDTVGSILMIEDFEVLKNAGHTVGLTDSGTVIVDGVTLTYHQASMKARDIVLRRSFTERDLMPHRSPRLRC